MRTPEERFDRELASLAELPIPPPSPALIGMVRASGSTRTRVPMRALLVAIAVAVVVVVLHTYVTGVRRDLGALPMAWFAATGVAWLAAFVMPLAVVLIPRRGSVLADSGHAALLAVVVPIVLVAMSIFLRVDAPPATVMPASEKELHYIRTCLLDGLAMAAIPFALVIFLLRRAAVPVQTRWLGASLGAAMGALAAFMLHVHCPVGGALHVAVGHAGASVVGALVGALVLPIASRRRAD